MDKRAAEQYLAKLFGTRKGYVAVAYKDKDQSWQESQFAWPADKAKLIGWASVHKDANLFICPALRQDAHTRKKGDMQPTQWLWADVDIDKVPADKRVEVESRIKDLGTFVVASGSGANRHVYVELTSHVSADDHIKLNTGLRDYLYADNKQTDNSLLRLPGTTNWKTEQGSPVRLLEGNDRKVTKANLLKRRPFRDAKVIADVDASEWTYVELEGLPRRINALVNMTVGEAEAKYGTRFKAVWAVVGELHKRGLGGDEIHSLMDKFPPAMSKAADENGYDVHRDVDKRLAWDRVQIATDEENDEDAGDVFEEMSAEEMVQSLVAEGVQKELLRRQVRRAADMAEASDRHTEPPADTSHSLSDALSAPPNPVQWLVEGLCSAEANVIITGQYKAGKTILLLASLIPALVDGHEFLGTVPVNVPATGVVVGHWNLEMGPTDTIDKYLRPVGIKNTDNLHLAHWRGYVVNILTPLGKATAVKWLKDRSVKVWTIDSFAQLARMSGVNTNDNDEVYALLGALNEVKQEAGVDVCFMLGHTGRNSDEKASSAGGLNATRGASAIDEFVDSRWVLTKDASEIRYLAAEGRDVDVEHRTPRSLEYDDETKRMSLGGMTKATAHTDGWVQSATSVVVNHGQAITESALITKMLEVAKSKGEKLGKNTAKAFVIEAAENGFIQRKREKGARGPMVWNHYPVEKPSGDRTRGATPREVNLSFEGGKRRVGVRE